MNRAPNGDSARRIVLWLVATAFVLVLLFSYHTSLGGTTPVPQTRPPGIVAPTPSGTSPGTDQPGGQPVVVDGSVVQTTYGPVQVEVTISGGRITDVVPLVYPSGRQDAPVNSYALPRLRKQVLAAQSARIDGVSGATATSDGYRKSLQAALDDAHFHG